MIKKHTTTEDKLEQIILKTMHIFIKQNIKDINNVIGGTALYFFHRHPYNNTYDLSQYK